MLLKIIKAETIIKIPKSPKKIENKKVKYVPEKGIKIKILEI